MERTIAGPNCPTPDQGNGLARERGTVSPRSCTSCSFTASERSKSAAAALPLGDGCTCKATTGQDLGEGKPKHAMLEMLQYADRFGKRILHVHATLQPLTCQRPTAERLGQRENVFLEVAVRELGEMLDGCLEVELVNHLAKELGERIKAGQGLGELSLLQEDLGRSSFRRPSVL